MLSTSTQVLHTMFYTMSTEAVMRTMMTQKHLIQFLYKLLDFHTKIHTHIQQVSFRITIRHSDSLLLIKWRWIIIKVFILVIVALSRLRTRRKKTALSCCLRGGRGGGGGKNGRGGRRGRHTQGNFMEIKHNF